MTRSGVVLLLGRPNVGKSTLLNNLIGRKVAITSRKPQTTRFPLEAVYEDERGQIIFVDTPGVFARVEDTLSRKIHQSTQEVIGKSVDVLLYIIDPTRPRDTEENKTLGMARKIEAPKILVINKSDVKKPDFFAEYAFYEDEFDETIRISATKRHNLNVLFEHIFALLPEREPLINATSMLQPVLNMDSKLFVSEIIREKVYILTHDEVPYTVQTSVEEINERPGDVVYIKGTITTTDDRYKKMLIGKDGRMIKEIGVAARKELETATGKRIYLDLTVSVNPHWQEAV